MNKLYSFLLGILWVVVSGTSVLAQTNSTFTYQGSMTNAAGQPVSGKHQITVKLYDASAEGQVLHIEQFDASVENGIFNLLIGSTTELPASVVSKARWL